MALTNQRVIYKEGLVRRNTIEMNIQKVESLDVRQSVFGRLFGYGDVLVRGTGVGLNPILKIADPLQFRNAVSEQIRR